MYKANVYNIMIGCPSDISKEEVNTIFDVIHSWNADNSHSMGIVLLPMHWSKNSYPIMGKDPQKIINEQMTDNSDIIICLFAGKLGTPTSTHESGTVEELQSHIEEGKSAMVFFKKNFCPGTPEEYNRIFNFRKTLETKGLYAEYETPADLRETLQHSITKYVNSYLSASVESIQNNISQIPLTQEEIELLEKWIKSNQLETYHHDFMGGKRSYVFGRLSVDAQDARTKAQMNNLLSKLEQLGFIEYARHDSHGTEIKQLTQKAFEYIDSLKQ